MRCDTMSMCMTVLVVFCDNCAYLKKLQNNHKSTFRTISIIYKVIISSYPGCAHRYIHTYLALYWARHQLFVTYMWYVICARSGGVLWQLCPLPGTNRSTPIMGRRHKECPATKTAVIGCAGTTQTVILSAIIITIILFYSGIVIGPKCVLSDLSTCQTTVGGRK